MTAAAAAAAAAKVATTTTTTAAATTMAPASLLSREVRGGMQGGRGMEVKADRSEYESKLPPPPPLASLTATPRTSLPAPPHTLLGSTAVKSTSGMFVKSSLVVGGDTGKVTVSYGNSALRQQSSGTARTSPTMSSFIPGSEAGNQHTMSSTAIVAPKSLQMSQANGSNAFMVTNATTSTSATSKIPSSGPISVDDVPLYLSRQQRPSYNNRPAYKSLSSSSSSYTGCSQNQQSTLQRLGVDNDAAVALARANAEAIAARFSAQLANNQSDLVVRSTNGNNQDLNSSYPPSNPSVSKSRWDKR
uniref:Uncharacterized protein n=2 Tax=Polytomella parva TaxID=51329 RepID=A0A7S0US11_9CHLO